MIVGPDNPPPPHAFYADKYERGTDPFHSSAMPDEFKEHGTQGDITNGWYLLDWCENQIGWCPDGTVIEDKEVILKGELS